MSTIYTNIPQTIKAFIPQLNKYEVVSTQVIDNNNNITFRSFNVYTFNTQQGAKDIRIKYLDGGYSPVYRSDRYYQITQEFRLDTYTSTQEVINDVLQPSFYTWEHTTTYINTQRHLSLAETLSITWTPPITEQQLTKEGTQLSSAELEQYLQPFTIQLGDVYGVSLPADCTLLTSVSNLDLLIDVAELRIKPKRLIPLTFSFKGLPILSIELPDRIVVDNPKLLYPKSMPNPPLVPPNVTGLRTDFPTTTQTPFTEYEQRRRKETKIITA